MMTHTGPSLHRHQKVLLFFWQRETASIAQAPIKEWLESAKIMEQENRTSQCSLQSRGGGGGSLNKKPKRRPAAVSARPPSVLCHQSMGRFSLCFFVNSSAFFMNFARSLLYSSARSARSGCSGWGLFTRLMRLWRTWGERGHKYTLFMCNPFTFKYKHKSRNDIQQRGTIVHFVWCFGNICCDQ